MYKQDGISCHFFSISHRTGIIFVSYSTIYIFCQSHLYLVIGLFYIQEIQIKIKVFIGKKFMRALRGHRQSRSRIRCRSTRASTLCASVWRRCAGSCCPARRRIFSWAIRRTLSRTCRSIRCWRGTGTATRRASRLITTVWWTVWRWPTVSGGWTATFREPAINPFPCPHPDTGVYRRWALPSVPWRRQRRL